MCFVCILCVKGVKRVCFKVFLYEKSIKRLLKGQKDVFLCVFWLKLSILCLFYSFLFIFDVFYVFYLFLAFLCFIAFCY